MNPDVLDIFREAACASLAVAPCKTLTLEAMWLFGQSVWPWPALAMAMGALCGVMLSYALGMAGDVLRQKYTHIVTIAHYDVARPYVLRYLSPLLLLHWVAPFMAISLVSGLFRVHWLLVVVLTLAGEVLRFAWLMH